MFCKPGDVQHHVEAEVFPHDDDQHGGERPILVREQIDGCRPESAGDRGREAVIAVEHVSPDQARADIGEHIGQKEDHPERHCADNPARDNHRDAERKRQLDEKRDGDDEAVVDERAHERRAVDQVAVILEADELLGLAVAVPVVKAVPRRLDHRQRDEDREEKNRRRQENEDGRPAVGGHPFGGFIIGGLDRRQLNEPRFAGYASPAANGRRGLIEIAREGAPI